MALTYQQAVEQTITGAEQFHEIINGSATSEVVVEDGSKIPSVRKALLDNFYFKDPIDWQQGENELVFNQIRKFTDGTWWIAPTSTVTNPVVMGVTPYGDPLWRVFSWDRVIDSQKANRKLIERSWAEVGYNVVAGSFQEGTTLNTITDVVINYGSDFGVYSWGGTLPKVVPANSTITGTGGVSPITWVSKDLFTLRQEIVSGTLLTSEMSQFNQEGVGSVNRTSQDKLRERITPQDKGAVGDGVTNDQSAFDALEAMVGDIQVDMLGKTYLVTTYPGTKSYFNGRFITVGDSVIILPNRYFEGYTRGKNTVVGAGAAPSLPANPTTSDGTANVVVGEDALKLGANTRSSIAVGTRAMYNAIDGKYNIAVGLESMFYVNADGSQFGGTRNVAVGDNSGRFITQGYQNVMMGRNAGQCAVLSYHNVTLGTDAMAGRGSLKFSDSQFIQNQTPYNTRDSVAVGYSASYFGAGDQSTSVGSRALGNAKSDATNCNAFGKDALLALGTKTGIHGKVQVPDARTGSYVMTPTDVTFTLPSHGLSVGWYVVVSFTSGVPYIDGQYYQVTQVIDTNTFKVSEPLGIATSGAFSMISYETATQQATCTRNTAIGSGAMFGVEYGTENIAIGTNAMAANTGGSYNTSVGDLSMRNLLASSFNTALGYLALQNKVDGTPMTSGTNCTGIGYNARVSGNDQIQLGNASTTTYVFGTVQNRSDARDKTEVRNTKLGIDFIMGLRPVDGRWDMRDDYIEEHQVQVGIDLETAEPVFETRIRQLPKDGSKARNRFHHWFIAQEVKELCDKLGVDFGGYQDHSLNGGCDVKTLGYDEFIPPTVKAVQQCWTRLNELEERIAKLEK